MFDVGFFELVLVFVMGLLILGPERLPKVARSVGQWTGRARAAFNNLRYELEREAMNEEMKTKFSKQLEHLGIDEDTLAGKTAPPEAESANPSTAEAKDQASPRESSDK